jgi:hypothetical protein
VSILHMAIDEPRGEVPALTVAPRRNSHWPRLRQHGDGDEALV